MRMMFNPKAVFCPENSHGSSTDDGFILPIIICTRKVLKLIETMLNDLPLDVFFFIVS